MKGLLVAAVAAVVVLATSLGLAAVPLAVAIAPPVPAGGLPATGPVTPPSPIADIPPPMLALYIAAAARCPGLPWTVLAAIGKVETDHGRGAEVSSAGAEGPMQFLPSTWAVYGLDLHGTGVPDINDPADAVFSAARLLCADGAGRPGGLPGAVFAYNHSTGYVAAVLAWAATYARTYAAGDTPQVPTGR